MNRFHYCRATSLAEALELLSSEQNSRPISGGTNLIDLMKYNVEKPSLLIDITNLEELKTFESTPDGGLRIGSLISNTFLAYDARITAMFPLLASAILAGATPQLRNAATVGGNLNQRTRCYYFNDPGTPCNKREPGSGCPAITGLNRIHAILGASSHCVATHPSDMCVALLALRAVVHVASANGERAIPIEEYHRLPGDEPQRDNSLRPGELVVAIEIPASSIAYSRAHSYLKLRDRLTYAFALVSVAAALEIENGVIASASVALGGVAHKPWQDADAAALLSGEVPGKAAFSKFADALLSGAKVLRDNAFKVDLAHRAVVRALAQAAAGTPQIQSIKSIA